MEAILNDYSLNGQFSEDEFTEYLITDIIPIMKALTIHNIQLLKNETTYSKSIISGKSLAETLRSSSNPAIVRLKSLISQLAYSEPYWNSDCRTKDDTHYVCPIEDIPNCITEAYERGAMLFSVRNSDFEGKSIEISCNGKNYDVRNFIDNETLNTHLSELGIIIIWEKNSFRIPQFNLKFEIRFDEHNHKTPHFHLSNADHSISLSIPDADILAGSLPKARVVIAWAVRNMPSIIDLWNKFHPENSVKTQT